MRSSIVFSGLIYLLTQTIYEHISKIASRNILIKAPRNKKLKFQILPFYAKTNPLCTPHLIESVKQTKVRKQKFNKNLIIS